MKKWVVCLVIGLGLLTFSTGITRDDKVKCGGQTMVAGYVCEQGVGDISMTYEEMKASHEAGKRWFESSGRWGLLGSGLFLTGLGVWGIVKVRRKKKEPYLGPGYVPGQAEPRQPGQPVGQYLQGMTPLPPGPAGVPQGYAPHSNHAPQHQAYPPQQQGYYPPQQGYYGPPQQQGYYPPPQQGFGPGSS